MFQFIRNWIATILAMHDKELMLTIHTYHSGEETEFFSYEEVFGSFLGEDL